MTTFVSQCLCGVPPEILRNRGDITIFDTFKKGDGSLVQVSYYGGIGDRIYAYELPRLAARSHDVARRILLLKVSGNQGYKAREMSDYVYIRGHSPKGNTFITYDELSDAELAIVTRQMTFCVLY